MSQNWVIWGQSPFASAAAESQIGHEVIGDFLFDSGGFLFDLQQKIQILITCIYLVDNYARKYVLVILIFLSIDKF
jgi:hypothetical protein